MMTVGIFLKMTDKFTFTTEEKDETLKLQLWLKGQIGASLIEGDEEKIRKSDLLVVNDGESDLDTQLDEIIRFLTVKE
jgi:hypothetical protein